MDPLSILASSLTLGAAVSATLSALLKLRSLRDSHSTITSWIVEIGDLRVILVRTQSLLEGRRNNGIDQAAVATLVLFRCHYILAEFEKLLQELAGGNPQIRRIKWLVRKEYIDTLRQSLHGARVSLVLALVEIGLLDHSDFRGQLERIESSVEIGREDMRRMLSGLLEEQALLRFDIRALHVQVEQLRNVNNTTVTQVLSVRDALADGTMTVLSIEPQSSTDNHSIMPTCTACCCRCHHRFRFDTPKFTSWLFGTSLFAFSGLPWGSCSETQCARQQQFKARITYRLPRWLLPRMLNLSYTSPAMGSGLTFTLRTSRVVPDNAEILLLTAQGDQKALEALFARGTASPHDVGSVYGLTPLHIALFKRNFALCEFLVYSAGADPYLNTGMRRCVIDIVREDILRKQLSTDEVILLKRLFVDVDDLDSFNFTPIHKSALGLSAVPLDCLLETSTASIDAQDSQGRTALLWATSSCNEDATRRLLEYGASPYISTRTGQSPLHHAVEYGSAECARLLLQAGARVDHQNRRGRTPLHYASRLDDEGRMSRILIQAGANVNVRDRGQSTPLHEAVQYGRHAQMTALIDAGADLSATDAEGRRPLDLAQGGLNNNDVEDENADRNPSQLHNVQTTDILLAAMARIASPQDLETTCRFPDDDGSPPAASTARPGNGQPRPPRRASLSSPTLEETMLGALPKRASSVSETRSSFVYRHYEGLGDLARVSGNRGLLAMRT